MNTNPMTPPSAGGVAGVLEAMEDAAHALNSHPHARERDALLGAIRTVEGMALALEKAESLIRGSDAEFYAIDATAKVGLGELLRLNLAAFGSAAPAGDGEMQYVGIVVEAPNGGLAISTPAAPAGDGEYEARYATKERLAMPPATAKCDFCGVRPGEYHAYDCTALDATPAGGGGEAVAEALWHRFGDDSRLTWDEEPEKAIYRDAAAQAIAMIRRLASGGGGELDANGLLPCPFCGAAALGVVSVTNALPERHSITCSDARCLATVEGRTAQRARLMWNRRLASTGSADRLAEQLKWALEQGGVLADWCNVARPALVELMAAYERRVRSDCKTEADLAAEPWRCAEFVQAEKALRAKPVPVVEIASTGSAPTATFQTSVSGWMEQCFDPSVVYSITERGDRLLEEVLELLQAHGYDRGRVPTLVEYVYGRPVGEPAQEVGGVMVTLAAYCMVAKLEMHAEGDRELARISSPEIMAKIRRKQQAKNALHFDTPLPGSAGSAPAPSAVLLQIAQAIVRDSMPATKSGQTCFVPRYQIDALAAALAPVGGEPC